MSSLCSSPFTCANGRLALKEDYQRQGAIALKREEKGDEAGGIWIEQLIKMPYLIIELGQTLIRAHCSQRKTYINEI